MEPDEDQTGCFFEYTFPDGHVEIHRADDSLDAMIKIDDLNKLYGRPREWVDYIG